MNARARTPKQLGEIVQRHPLRSDLTQSELGKRVGLRQATISQIESGYHATKITVVCDLLAALGLELTVAPRMSGSAADIEAIF